MGQRLAWLLGTGLLLGLAARPAPALAAPSPAPAAIGLDLRGPAPLPAPIPPPLPLADDPLDVLWGHRVQFSARGEPLVAIRLAEGLEELAVRAAGPVRLVTRDGQAVGLPAGTRLLFRTLDARPALLAYRPQLGEAPHAERSRLAALRALWARRGVEVQERVTGGVYGIAGRVVDTRRTVLVAAGDGTEASARAFADAALARYEARTATFVEPLRRPSGRVEAFAPGGAVASGEALLTLDPGEGALVLERAGQEPADERSYRGQLHVTLDPSGRLAAVLAIGIEELLRGLVPSEIPAGSAPAALEAQAVAARSNVLAQLGTRHLDSPWLLCSDVHCQAYRGQRAQAAATDAAVRATAGEALLGRDRRLVDGVYSALCGGHGEDDDAVWPVLPTPALRGRPDLPPGEASPGGAGLRDERVLRAFLVSPPRAWCARARAAPPHRYRWERHVAQADLDAFTSSLGVGHVQELLVTARGVSGRARALRVVGETGQALVEGELTIRRLLGNLPSAMFVVDREEGALVLRGGGWGHGVGLCQWGAIGRAEAGQGYRRILAAYYAGAEVVRVY